MINHENGRIGEDIACEFFEVNGFEIVCRNFRAGHNEIDIIARNDTSLVFAEVKTRTKTPFLEKYGSAKIAVNRAKRKHLVAAATYYIKKFGLDGRQPRMDVVEVYLKENGNLLKINYIRCAFGAGGKY